MKVKFDQDNAIFGIYFCMEVKSHQENKIKYRIRCTCYFDSVSGRAKRDPPPNHLGLDFHIMSKRATL